MMVNSLPITTTCTEEQRMAVATMLQKGAADSFKIMAGPKSSGKSWAVALAGGVYLTYTYFWPLSWLGTFVVCDVC